MSTSRDTHNSQKHKQYVGVGNELILENLKKLFKANAKIWIRIPIVPSSFRNLPQKENSLITNTAPATYLAGADVFKSIR